jgi:hypothetical protein
LGVVLLGLLLCFGGVLYVHHYYVLAAARYEDGINHIVLRPHSGAVQQLNLLAAEADRWWWGQLWCSLLTFVLLIGVVVLLRRRGRERAAVAAKLASLDAHDGSE